MAKPKSQMLILTEQLTRNIIVPDLDEKSLHALTLTCKHYQNQCYKDKHTDKKVASEMLDCVLNPTLPNQKRFLELLSTPRRDKNGQPLYLIQSHGEEVYFNVAKARKTKTMRYSTNVLEAILRTKNFHFAKTLFDCIPAHEKTENLRKYISVIKSQDIWGMPELQISYKNFISSWQILNDAKKLDELDRLCGSIGHALKEHLPWFSIYLFCHPVTHSKADYTKAPNWTCVLWDDSELDLDLFSAGSINGICKGLAPRALRCGRGVSGGGRVSLDSAAFASQSKVLSSELDKTIKLYGLDVPTADSTTKPVFG